MPAIDDGRPAKRPQRRLIACQGCREIRMRCIDNESQRDPCQRCRRLNIPCIYARKRRRTKSELRELDSQPAQRRRDGRAQHVPSPARPLDEPAPYEPGSSDTRFNDASREDDSPRLSSPRMARVEPRSHATMGYLDPDIHRSEPAHAHSVPSDASPQEERVYRGAYAEDDPIAMDLLSAIEAEHLCLQFMRHLNPLTALLDPQLHTLEYIRRTSSALLSAVLMCAAKFFRRPLYAPLLAHTRTLVNRVTSTGNNRNLGTIQALALMVSWKEPTDSTSGLKMAIAIRLGYELGLHVPRTMPLPEDKHEARVIADGERTWFVLSCFDRIFSDVFGLPPTMRLEELPNCIRWAEETQRIHGGDMRHACSMSSASTYLMLIRLRRTYTTMRRETAWALLNDIYTQMELHLQQWFPEDQSQGKFSPYEQTILKWFDINHLMRTKFLMLDVCPDAQRDLIVADWLDLAERYTTQTELISGLGCMGYMQDTSATHLSSFGVIGHKMCARLPVLQRQLVVEYIRRLSACCDTRTDTAGGDAVMDVVGRFLRRLLQLLADETQSLPQPDDGAFAPQDPFGAFGLDEFLRNALPIPQIDSFDPTMSIDDQFWSMLFPDPNIGLPEI